MVLSGNELSVMKEMYAALSLSMHTCSEKAKLYAALCMHAGAEKKTFVGKDDLTIVE